MRFVFYPLTTLLFLVVSLFVVVSAFGYEVSLKDGKFFSERTGIIIISSTPGEAEVYLNEDIQKKKTPALSLFNLKLNRLKGGDYNIKVAKEGYIPWIGSLSVTPGLVTWLDYIILVPLEKEAAPLNFAGKVEKAVVSDDKKAVMVSTLSDDKSIQTIWRIDVQTKTKNKIYEADVKKSGKREVLSLSHGNSRYLFKETVDKDQKFKVAEVKENGLSWDISGQFAINVSSLNFSPYSHDELFLLSGDGLYKINFIKKAMSASIASGVKGVYSNMHEIGFIRDYNNNIGLWRIARSNEIENVIKALPDSKSYNIKFSKEKNYYAVLVVDEKDLIIYSNGEKNPKLETIAKSVSDFEASPSGENIAFLNTKGFFVYNLKNEGLYKITNKNIKKMSWLKDSSNLIYQIDKEVRMVNFDGQYNTPLFEALDDNLLLASPTNNNIYFTSRAKDDDSDIYIYGF